MAEPESKRARFDGVESLEQHGLAVMLTEIEEEANGTILLWGLSPHHQERTVLLVVPDYRPSFYLPCPFKADPALQTLSEPQHEDIRQLQRQLNRRLPPESQLEALQVQQQHPIMYYRPEQPDGAPYLKCTLKPGANVKRAAGVVEKLVAGGSLPGFSWRQRGTDAHEVEVKLLTRFLCDASLSGGSWVWVFSIPAKQQQQQAMAAAGSSSSSRQSLLEVVPPGSSRRRSSCVVEVVCSWSCLHSLTPDATQLAAPHWRPQVLQELDPVPPGLHAAAAAAASGDILPLKLLVLDVLLATADGSSRTCNPDKDPVVTIACHITHSNSSSSSGSSSGGGGGGTSSSSSSSRYSPPEGGASSSGAAGSDMLRQQQQQQRVAFVLAGGAAQGVLPQQLSVEGLRLMLFPTEAELLLAWRDWVLRADPDGIAVFQVRDNLGVLAARFAALDLDGGGCHISRMLRQHSRGLSTKSVVMYSVAWVKSQSRMASTSNQETFRALGLPGRLVMDVLRQVLTSQGLATFSLVDCCHSLLKRTLEVIPSHTLAALQQQLAATPPEAAAAAAAAAAAGGGGDGVPEDQLPGVRAGLRLARYSLGRCLAVASLMERLASVPEVFEMARATGLTLEQVLYNAQMIRTWSLLLRTSHRRGYIVAGRTDSAALVESPYLMHPIEHKTAGLYTTPVATLDFASLYPSLYRAYNLCYTTLVHPDDVARIGADCCTITPTGAAFLQPAVRPGILPAILSALMSARAATRGALKDVQKQLQQARQAQQHHKQQPPEASSSAAVAAASTHAAESVAELAARAAVLDGRQKALKVTANALYGFTGAQASPLQCAPLADSCLALGAATCRTAATAITAALAQGLLGPKGEAGKVIYAQTDSVFIHFPSATAAEAVGLGQQAAQLVTAQLQSPIELQYERVLCPFMLLHVNRYAGCSYETAAAAEAGGGQLLVKGIKAVWRQSAPLLQHTLMGALELILMQRDVPAAMRYAEGQIARLLSGRIELWELVMTGGLWRVTGQQLEKAAAAADASGNGYAAGGSAAGGVGDDDVKGPHASLAVRLSQRDPGKKWLLGERLPYVLLSGSRTQDEAAEDPLTAAQLGVSPNYELYFTNKLQIPLKEIFSTCLNPEQMRQLLHGDHTKLRASTTTAGDLGPPPMKQQQQQQQWQLGVDQGPAATAAAAGAAATAAGSQGREGRGRRGRGGRGSGRGAGGAGAAALSPDRKKGAAAFGMRAFFQRSARCLGCRAVIHTKPAPPAGPSSSNSSSGSSGGNQEEEQQQQQQQQQRVDPGLCNRCIQEDGKREAVQIAVTHEASEAASKVCRAQSTCRSCHSGGQMGAIVCENGECPVVYERLSGERQVVTAEHKLLRLESLDW